MADVAAVIPLEPSTEDPDRRAVIKAVLVRNLLLSFGAMRRNGMLGPKAELELVADSCEVVVRLLEDDELLVGVREPVGGSKYKEHHFTWDSESQLYSALGELFQVRAVQRSQEP